MPTINKAVFLLAGTSSRFKGIVDHKALLKLHGQTLLERQIIQAANYGVSHYVFVIGGAQEPIVKEVSRIFYQIQVPFLQATLVNCPCYETTNNAQSLYECREELRGWCFLFECDVAAILPQNLPMHSSLWFTVKEYKGDGSFVFVAPDGYLSGQVIIRNGDCPDESWQKSAGIFLLSPITTEGLRERLLRPPDPKVYLDNIMPLAGMRPYSLKEWREIDTVEDFETAKEVIKSPVAFLPPDPSVI